MTTETGSTLGMTRRLFLGLGAAAAVAGCARVRESRFNPLNWFGRSERSTQVVTPGSAADPRGLVSQVIELRVDPVPDGAIVRATGLPPLQGFYDGELVPVDRRERPDENGVLNYEFRISPPLRQTRVSTQQSREVIVGRFVSTQTLEPVRAIRVSGALNALITRR